MIRLGVVALATLALGLAPPAEAHQRGCATGSPAFRGSFLQPDLGDSWTPAQWRRELRLMRASCQDTLVLQWTADSLEKTAVFPPSLAGYRQSSAHDVVDEALSTADREGIQVWLGLGVNNDWWSKSTYDRAWFQDQVAEAQRIEDDLWRHYRRHRSLRGFYLPFEAWNADEPDAATRATLSTNLGDGLRELAVHAHRTTGLPVMTAPFFNTTFTDGLAHWTDMWRTVLARAPIDVLAPQDGVGAGHAQTGELATWFGATRDVIEQTRPATRLWVDTETYTIADSRPMGINKVLDDMVAVRDAVSGYLSFSFNHYISPQQVNPLYFRTYERWVRAGRRDTAAPAVPGGLSGTGAQAQAVLQWSPAAGDPVGYRVYRDGQFAGAVYDGVTTFSDGCLEGGRTYRYQLASYDAAGNESARSADLAITTSEAPHFGVDLALHQPYTASSEADASYPDSGGTELTDGLGGSLDFFDAAWQGRLTSDPYHFDVDLGTAQPVHEISSRWLQVQSAAIMVPQKVTYSVSSDGETFTAVGDSGSCPTTPDDQVKSYTVTGLQDVNARYVRVAVSPGDAWNFIDEVEVR
jgi:uncharacterized protein DUF4434/F5/8 type C domain-containing protein